MKIYDGRESFYQWDLNQRLILSDYTEGDEVHFTNIRQSKALPQLPYELDGEIVVDVPNILLQTSVPLLVYHYKKVGDSEYTSRKKIFDVEQRPKPDDYIYTETEIYNYTSVVNKALEDAKNSGDFKGDKGEPGKDGINGKDGVDGKNGTNGYTPKKGTDYWTEVDKAEIKDYVDEAILGGAW